MSLAFSNCHLGARLVDIFFRQVLHDEQGRVAIGDKTSGDTAIGPASLACVTVRCQHYQIGIRFVGHIVQNGNGTIADGRKITVMISLLFSSFSLSSFSSLFFVSAAILGLLIGLYCGLVYHKLIRVLYIDL